MRVLVICDRRHTKLKPAINSFADSEIVYRDTDGISGYLSLIIRSFQQLLRSRPDVVIGSNAFPAVLALLIGRLSGSTVIWRIGGDWVTHRIKFRESYNNFNIVSVIKYSILISLNEILFKTVDGMIVVNCDLKEKVLKKTDLPKHRVHIVRVPLRDSLLESFQSIEIDPCDNKNIITVTNFDHYVKYSAMVDALPQIINLLKENEEYHYWIAGGGTYISEFNNHVRDSIDELSLLDRIHVCGHISDIVEFYELGDLMVYVSYSDGYPNVIIEAQAAGIPVIANGVGGIPNQIDDGRSGLLIPTPKSKTLHGKIREVFENPQLYQKLTHNARSIVGKRNSYENISKEYEKTINRIYDQCTEDNER